MSTENKSGEGQKPNDEGQKVDVNEIQKRLEQLESSYSRVLEESKSHKAKAQEYKAKLDETEKKSVEASGDIAKQLEYERKQREEAEGKIKSLSNKTLDQNIRSTVGKFARDVHDLDDLLNQPQFSHILKSGIDKEKLSVDENAAKDFVNKVLEAKPWLKKNMHQPGVDSTKPKGDSIKTPELGDIKKGEHKEHMKSALAKW